MPTVHKFTIWSFAQNFAILSYAQISSLFSRDEKCSIYTKGYNITKIQNEEQNILDLSLRKAINLLTKIIILKLTKIISILKLRLTQGLDN